MAASCSSTCCGLSPPRLKLLLSFFGSDATMKSTDELKVSFLSYLRSCSLSLLILEENLEIKKPPILGKRYRDDPIAFGTLYIQDLRFLRAKGKGSTGMEEEIQWQSFLDWGKSVADTLSSFELEIDGEKIRVMVVMDSFAAMKKSWERDENLNDDAREHQEIVDVDSDVTNPDPCCVYAVEIHNNQRCLELIQRPSSLMEKVQHHVDPSARSEFIGELVQVADNYGLDPHTLYLTVYIMDRYLSEYPMERHELPLLGGTAMLIASKYEEVRYPRLHVEQFCLSGITKSLILDNEIRLLSFLDFKLSSPTVHQFLRRYTRAALASYNEPFDGLGHMADYIAELTLLEVDFLRYIPSMIAASAVFLAKLTLDQSEFPWTPTLVHYTAYEASALKEIVLAMHRLLKSNNLSLNVIREKYNQAKFHFVAAMVFPEECESLFTQQCTSTLN